MTHPSEWKKNRAAWVKALRTRFNAKQCQGQLHDVEGNHCCLGVLEVLAGEAGCNPARSGAGGLPGIEVCDWVGLASSDGEYAPSSSLAVHNDSGKWSFDQIADLIESEPPGLFRPIPESENDQ